MSYSFINFFFFKFQIGEFEVVDAQLLQKDRILWLFTVKMFIIKRCFVFSFFLSFFRICQWDTTIFLGYQKGQSCIIQY